MVGCETVCRAARDERPFYIDDADRLSRMLLQEAGRSRKQKRTIKQLRADLVALGYQGSYNRVATFARDCKAAPAVLGPAEGRWRGAGSIGTGD